VRALISGPNTNFSRIFATQLAIVNDQVKSETARIDSEFDEGHRGLHELKEIMGKKYATCIGGHSTDFPRIPPETHLRMTTRAPDEARFRLNETDAERDLRKSEQKYGQDHDEAETDAPDLIADALSGLQASILTTKKMEFCEIRTKKIMQLFTSGILFQALCREAVGKRENNIKTMIYR
jgi:hypothetical protein